MANNLTVTNIAQQIDQAADYYPPATYLGTAGGYAAVASRLTTYNEWTYNADSLADQYIALSAVPQRGRNPKIFAIGVIPPSADVTGRILDRSASINSVADVPPYVPTTGQPGNPSGDRSAYVKSLLEYACNPPRGRGENDPTYQQVTEGRDVGKAQKSYSSCGDLAHWILYRLGVRSDFVNRNENKGWKDQANISKLAFSPAAEVPSASTQYKPGDIIIIWSEANGSDAHAIVVSEQTGANKLETGEYGQPGGAIKNRTIKIKDGVPYMGNRKVQRIIPLEKVLAMAREKGELADVQLPNGSGPPQDTENTKWDGKTAAQAREMQEKTANTPLVDVVREMFTAAQKAQILDLSNAIESMKNVPPLRMMVNPSSVGTKAEKIVADSGWSRNGGTIVEHWGNNQEKLSASGKLAGFYAIDFLNATGPGLTRTARNFSQSWQNFQSMVAFYANNGGIHLQDPTTNNAERNLSILGSIYIYYDGILHIGSFDTLSVSESDTSPHTVDYSFEFTVRASFLLDNPVNDSNNYGVSTPSNAAQNPTVASFSGR